MLSKMRKMLKSQKGFTLIELMTVLIILGVVLGIGIPKYLQVQAKAEWEADVNTITNFARAAEVYAASLNEFTGVTINQLIAANLIDEKTVLNRTKKGAADYTSEKNTDLIGDQAGSQEFKFNDTTGNVNNLGKTIREMIGDPPYGGGPVFPGDAEPAGWPTS